MLSVVRITIMIFTLFSTAVWATDGSLNIEGHIINGTCKVEGVVIDPDEGGSGVPSPNIDFEFASNVFIDGDTQSTNQTGDVRFFIRLAHCQATAEMQNVRPRFLTSGTLDSGGRLINMDKNGPQNFSMYIYSNQDVGYPADMIGFNQSTGKSYPLPLSPEKMDMHYIFRIWKTDGQPTKVGPILGIISYEVEYF